MQAITAAVKGVDASADVKVDLAAKSVEVSTSAAGERVTEAIRQAGYTPADATQAAAPVRASCSAASR